jgi:ABC-type transport system substrate-binding protein
VAWAWNAAVDRFLLADTVYLSDAKVSATAETPWFNAFWSLPEDELLSIPGWRPDRGADVEFARGMLEAAGVEPGTDFFMLLPDVWEATYPGITETTKAMYESATGMTLNIDVQPYTVFLQRLEEGNYPGGVPAWTNPPADLDPTTAWNNGLIPGGSTNLQSYDYQPVTDLVTAMQTTLDLDERKGLAQQVLRIGLGQDEAHGLDGIFPGFGVMNGIQRVVSWPYVNASDDARTQFAHNFHRYDDAWMDTNHPDFPG